MSKLESKDSTTEQKEESYLEGFIISSELDSRNEVQPNRETTVEK